MTARYIVAYDISHDAVRRQVRRLLDAYGQRRQRSVYEAVLTDSERTTVVSELTATLGDSDGDRVDIVRVASRADPSTITLGDSRNTDTSPSRVL